MEITVTSLVEQYGLLPHPEGGYYKENYRSNGVIPADALPGGFSGERNFSTAIYFLLQKDNFSAFHRILSDECWHFYHGAPANVYVIDPDGNSTTIHLGNDMGAGQQFQAIVPAGCWFASETLGDFSFTGCTVAPGFDFRDFEMADADVLAKEFPQHEKLIRHFCRKNV
ncbi:cupin domain-containing protein [Ferruginibacter sp. HRS2-29]|uniref:cupin domain-containing protein n=1 Tax=Ferruginibacter sp. HRS2-29 TaxID=2487334 RepID=UPI0020CCE6B6|nr:cupin domain-containing protein [Ferruginibacter sp. HRS2-29]MCP9750334.1 cupin domain-containing protein [Ferruginibacter sp. HRS2-29]